MATTQRFARLASAGGVVFAVAAFAGGSARGLDTGPSGESVKSLSSRMAMQADGTLAVNETIDYDFASTSRHGIYRYIPDEYDCDLNPDANPLNSLGGSRPQTPSTTGSLAVAPSSVPSPVGSGPNCKRGYDRVTPVSNIAVRSPSGASTKTKVSQQSGSKVIRIGDPNRTTTGRHTYVVDYTLKGVINRGASFDTIALNVIGSGWQVPFEQADASLQLPVAPTQATCVAGPPGSTRPCTTLSVDATAVHASVASLAAGESVTLYVEVPAASIGGAPILRRRWSLGYAFSHDGGSLGLAAGTVAVGAAAVTVLGRRGRDRRFAGSDVEFAMGRAGQAETARGTFEKLPEVMEFAPPAEIRPGQLGTLVDERVDTRDITATIVDLAIRKYLRIDEVANDKGRVVDHALVRLPEPQNDPLRPYESLLLRELFGGSGSVQLSALKQHWSGSFAKVRGALYDDVVASGWYAERPDRRRRAAIALGFVVLVAGIVATVVLLAKTSFGFAGLAIIATGVAMMIVARRAPVRTATGTAMAARSAGFRRLIETPTQQDMARFAERHDVFIDYLPFAIVFGCATRWAHTFAALGALPPPINGWYTTAGIAGYAGATAPSWDAISQAVSDFASSAGASLQATAPSSSGSGFSSGSFGGGAGGGFGGGGGGSW